MLCVQIELEKSKVNPVASENKNESIRTKEFKTCRAQYTY